MANPTEAPATSTTAEGPNQHTLNQAVTRPSNTFGYTRAEQVEALHKLREPFLPKEIRYLPRVWCKACKSAGWDGCKQHPVTKCEKCTQKMPKGGHIDLAFVGHAEATNRLLNVDPFWDWEPLTVDERGLPQVDGYRGLWIRLTVCGMTRLGYGHAGDKTGGDAIKEVIGDAIRNAGMRFGMALDLWTPSDLQIIESGSDGTDDASKPTAGSQQKPAAAAGADPWHLDRLVGQAQDCWGNAIALTQILADAQKHKVDHIEVDGPNGLQVFSDLLNDRISFLNQPTADRSAA
ncbi:hypothetical protein E6R18_24925 [Streptomyces sp. A1277]|uniref:hypothetical protein n=1 Tax=Streptomyces sp. A1277 TaxID=2563103 RepID=UPI0010A22955|nr:hypothetical protein [Streptomyces sp. A1277]THA29158.1 hypothetical protein E6R18_24925 [Streptomyces sp. A1277]